MQFEDVSFLSHLTPPEKLNGRASENRAPEHGSSAKIIRDPPFFSLR